MFEGSIMSITRKFLALTDEEAVKSDNVAELPGASSIFSLLGAEAFSLSQAGLCKWLQQRGNISFLLQMGISGKNICQSRPKNGLDED